MKEDHQSWVHVGRIGRVKGLKGELRVELFNPISDLWKSVSSVALGQSPNQLASWDIDQVKREAKGWVIRFAGIQKREDARALVGKQVYVERAFLPEPEDGEYYHVDLIGCLVETDQGRALGILREITSTPSNDIYVVDGPEGELLLPGTKGVVTRVDLAQGKIVVKPPEVLDAF